MRLVLVIWLVGVLVAGGAALAPAPTAHAAQMGGVAPTSIRIPQALVNTTIEPLAIPGGVPEVTTSPWTVGWYEEMGRLGIPGNVVLFGYIEWWTVGPAVFHFVSQLLPGSQIELAGEDGNLYRYQLEWAESYPRDTAPIGIVFDPGLGTDEMLTIYLAADPFDPATGEYDNILVLRARRNADAPAPAPVREPNTLFVPDGCPVAPETLALPEASQPYPYQVAAAGDTAPSSYLQQMGIQQAAPADPESVAGIDAVLAQAAACDIGVREALQLPDGNVLALVGPAGALPLAELAGTVQPRTRGVTDETLANVCAYLLFAQEDGAWRLMPSPQV